MKKQKFSELLRHYNKMSSEDLKSLIQLEEAYPYSQPIHNLVAKASVDKKSTDAKKKLTKAAVYATDRAILKSLIENKLKFQEEVLPTKEKPVVEKPVPQERSTEAPAKPEKMVGEKDTKKELLPIDQVRKEVMEEVEKLQGYKEDLKWLFEEDDDDFGKEKPKKKKSAKKKKKTAKKETDKSKKKKSSKSETKKTSKKETEDESVAEAKKVKTATDSKTKKKAKTKAKPKSISKPKTKKKSKTKKTETKADSKKKSKAEVTGKKSKDDEESDDLNYLGALEKKKKKKAKKDKKQKEQIRIIDEFINSESDITIDPEESSDSKSDDLSKQSIEFDEDLVSENLARIFIKQGKSDKAIDIYKKLIWKFPQKKTYFATQIENLRKG